MCITGFTIIKNAVKYDYPAVASIKSVLPLVNEMIVLVGDCDDDTEALIRSINSPKIKIHHSVWDPQLKKGGEVLAVETNKAFDLVPETATWALYIQADEVIHEQYHETILAAAEKYKNDQRVEGLLFEYTHFYGSYDYVGDSRRWYKNEIRMVRNDKRIRSYRDAQGFRKEGRKLQVKRTGAKVYHYGWVRHPHAQLEKLANFYTYWDGPEARKRSVEENELFDYLNNADSLQKFTGTHPEVMRQRIAEKNWHMEPGRQRRKMSFKDHLLYRIEKWTGKRLFDYKNYRIV
ncbi:MAG: glycosyltransferase family 2 protein [Dinghuibacter sp.]|nr:glycosyltransferase family 2 protein [Dinghuibacter sp.]